MPKDWTNPPDRQRKNFPDRLGSLVLISGLEETLGSDPVFELETFQPNGFGTEREGGGDWVDEKEEEGIRLVGDADGCHGDREVAVAVARGGRVGTSRSGQVSVLEVIAADEKRSDLEYELSQEEINLEKLQRIASKGLPNGGGSRARVWQLLLGYLPPSRNLWDKELAENRQKYAKLKEEFLISPSEFSRRRHEDFRSYEPESESGESDGPLRRHEISQEDHPLSLGKASVWHQFFQNTEITDQIDRDLQRTHPDMKFFSGETLTSRKHREAMRNILLLFAKLNPAIQYVQGMNEVLALLYYVFSTDIDEQNAANAEADSFACFVRVLSDSVDHFCQQLDNSSVGILSTLSRLSELLRANNEKLWRHLEFTTKVKPQFYAFRWITLLLTQEFDFKSILRIWDSFLGNPFGVQDMLLRVCCAMLLCVKSQLLSGDFIANLKLLQHYPQINIDHLLQVVAMATTAAMAVSGTVILLVLRLHQKTLPGKSPFHPCITSSSSGTEEVHDGGIRSRGEKQSSSITNRRKKNKGVQFADGIADPAGYNKTTNNNSRSRPNSSSSTTSADKVNRGMPENRMALYNGILRDRSIHRLAYYY